MPSLPPPMPSSRSYPCCQVSGQALCLRQPYLDASIAQRLQRGPDIGLQLVLHASQTQQLHLHLQALDHRGHLERAVMHTQLGLDIAGLWRGEKRKERLQHTLPFHPGQLGLEEVSAGLLKTTNSNLTYVFICQ